jgi:hypothetical protein
MSGRFWAIAALGSVFALLHCGGSVRVVDDGAGASGRGGSGHGGQAGHAGRVGLAGAGSAGLPLDAGFDEYVDPGCPDAGPATEVRECDPFSAMPNCPVGDGCYPFVDQPLANCSVQTFGTQCLTAGPGRQGDNCGGSSNRCASGFVCVVGSEPGKHCVKLCMMGVQSSCPAGLICGELDVEGFGVCS